ncbi:MAG TPA: lysophospholipid acyltransferase family protein, partial [candidate division Zixibacteria bacterium]|nr:lysophospholipid acyltransferase family protein [candidate division Zixibacteria bacterium]
MINPIFDIGYLLSRFTATVLMGCRPEGREHLPRTGGFILASNHISNLDPPLVGCYVTRRVHFFAKRELFDIPVLGWMVRQANSHPVKRGVF